MVVKVIERGEGGGSELVKSGKCNRGYDDSLRSSIHQWVLHETFRSTYRVGLVSSVCMDGATSSACGVGEVGDRHPLLGM